MRLTSPLQLVLTFSLTLTDEMDQSLGPDTAVAKELANAAAVLANTEVHWEALEENLTAALGLVSRFGQAYRRADSMDRRSFNRAVVESIHVDVGGEVNSVVLAEPFKTLLDDGLVSSLICEMNNRRPSEDGGSTFVKLVEVSGLEPPTSTLRT